VEVEISELSNYSLKETALESRYFLKKILRPFPTFQLQSFLKNIEKFSMQVKNRE
jgi:hypothetical protein